MKFFLTLALLLSATLTLGISLSFATLTSEKLGYSPTEKLLIIHADDIGMSHTVNRASFEAFRIGLVRSGSVMAPTPWVDEVKHFVQENPGGDLGLHFTLTSEWKFLKWGPLFPSANLTDPFGHLWPNMREVLNHATAQDIENELDAQIRRLLAYGIHPTHIDSHMGIHFGRKDFLEAVIRVSKKFNIPPMLVRPSEDFAKEAARYHLPLDAINLISLKAEKEGIYLLDYLITGVQGRTTEERRRAYIQCLKNLKPGVTQLIVHLGFLDDEMKGIMSDAPEGFERRQADTAFFTSNEAKKLLEELNVKIITWKELTNREK